MSAPAISEYTMFTNWMSDMLAPNWFVSAEVASDTAPLSPDVPIWAMTKTMMGSTKNFSARSPDFADVAVMLSPFLIAKQPTPPF